MRNITLHPHGLLTFMLDFIVAIDQRMLQFREACELHEGAYAETRSGDEDLLLIKGAWSDLVAYVRRYTNEAGSANIQLGPDTMTDFSYILAAWADETLVRCIKPEFLDRCPSVEETLFATKDAGEQIFSNIDALLVRRSLGDQYLAPAYLMLLSLGFRGQYHDSSSGKVGSYHRALLGLALSSSEVADRQVESLEKPSTPKGVIIKISRFLPIPALWCLLVVIWGGAFFLTDQAWRESVLPLREILNKLDQGVLINGTRTGEVRP